MNDKDAKKYLHADEKIIDSFGVSKRYCNFYTIFSIILGTILLIISIFVGNFIGNYYFSFVLLFLLICVVFYFQFGIRYMYRYIVTDKRIISMSGILHTKSVSIQYRSITDIYLIENILNKTIIKAGTIHVNTAGADGFEMDLYNIDNPYKIKMKLSKMIENVKHYTHLTNEEKNN